MAGAISSPASTRAVLIGLEHYRSLEDLEFRLPGVCATSFAVARWLVTIGVPLRGISMWLDPVDDGSEEDLLQRVRTEGLDGIDVHRMLGLDHFASAFDKPAGSFADGDSLFVHIAGHGLADGHWRSLLLRPDATRDQIRVLDLMHWRMHFHAKAWERYGQQLWLIDTCRNSWLDSRSPVISHPWANEPPVEVQQFGAHSCSLGATAAVASSSGPQFSRALLGAVSKTPTGTWPNWRSAIEQAKDHLESLNLPQRPTWIGWDDVGDSDQRLPGLAHPTEGLATSEVASRLVVDRLDSDSTRPSFDIGTVWGLSRGRTFGLVAGFRGRLIFQSLVTVEEMLFDAASKAGRSLPPRFWFRYWFAGPAAEPADESSLHTLLRRIDSGPRSARLARAGWPDGVALGLLLEVPFESESQWSALEPSLSAWLRSLARIGRHRPLDVIVHVQARTRLAGTAAVERLLAGIPEDARSSVEAVQLRSAPAQYEVDEAAARAQTLLNFGFEDFGARAAEEDQLARWLGCAGFALQSEPTDNARSLKLATECPKIIAIIKSLHIRPCPEALPGPAVNVLARLNEVAPDDTEVDEQFLSFIDLFLPAYTGALLRAYGTGARASGHSVALKFASRSRERADAYVEGALAAGRFPSERDLRASGPGTAEILRSLARRRTEPRAAQEIKKLSSRIALHGILEEPALAPIGADADASSIWELLAEPISRERLELILSAPLVIRAAFGLIETTEWLSIISDEHRFRRVQDLRGDSCLRFELPVSISKEVN